VQRVRLSEAELEVNRQVSYRFAEQQAEVAQEARTSLTPRPPEQPAVSQVVPARPVPVPSAPPTPTPEPQAGGFLARLFSNVFGRNEAPLPPAAPPPAPRAPAPVQAPAPEQRQDFGRQRRPQKGRDQHRRHEGQQHRQHRGPRRESPEIQNQGGSAPQGGQREGRSRRSRGRKRSRRGGDNRGGQHGPRHDQFRPQDEGHSDRQPQQGSGTGPAPAALPDPQFDLPSMPLPAHHEAPPPREDVTAINPHMAATHSHEPDRVRDDDVTELNPNTVMERDDEDNFGNR
jgi:hypothetical protein